MIQKNKFRILIVLRTGGMSIPANNKLVTVAYTAENRNMYLFNYIIEYHGNKHHLQALLQFLTQMGVRGGGYVPVFLMRNALWHSIFYYFSSCEGMLPFVYDVSSRWEEQHDTRNKWEIKALYFMWNSQRGKKITQVSELISIYTEWKQVFSKF